VKLSFSHNQRLSDSKLFEKALRNKALVESWLAIHCVQNTEKINRLGIIVSKRIIAKAHDRNRTKRYIREAFRKKLINSVNSYDIVVRIRKEVYVSEKADFLQAMCRLLREVGK
jgi:ribonuclease P protein component